jgi:hypothetical protein
LAEAGLGRCQRGAIYLFAGQPVIAEGKARCPPGRPVYRARNARVKDLLGGASITGQTLHIGIDYPESHVTFCSLDRGGGCHMTRKVKLKIRKLEKIETAAALCSSSA